jgi:ligand-binding sensor domain-containing protein
VISVAIDPANDNHVFASFYGRGVGEFLDNKLINFYNEKNSSLQKTSHPNFYRVEPTDMAFDGNRNLWVINQRADNTLCMRKPDGTWNSYLLSGSLKDYIVWKLLIDQAGQKWLVLVKGLAGGIPKLGVFNDKGTIDNKSDDSFRFIDLKLNTGEGVVPAAPVCLASDNDGTVWVGTDHGIAVYYTPGEVMDNPAPEQILIQQDGSTQYLLEFETITAIAVDGANRKWVGTARAGVFLFNSDGTRELLHFTEDNSPLLSNEIKTIAVNDHTGEVFFGTPLGIVSYKSTATKGRENLGEAFVYPNPVPPGYTGKIGITGLAENMNVKITDSFGRLVYETRSNGGQAVWDGRTLNGDRIQTGIFLVFCSDDTGEKTVVTKLVFIR